MKETIGTIKRTDLRKKRGHEDHLSGTGAHKNRKRYSRNVKHKNQENYKWQQNLNIN